MEEQKSSKKGIIIAIIVILLIIAMIIGAIFIFKGMSGGKNKKLDVPYYGKITIGDTTVDMASTEEELEKMGFKMGYYVDENPNTNDKFDMYSIEEDDYIEYNYTIYSDLIDSKYDFGRLDDPCKNLKLPQNITFESKIDDVIKAYGEPSKRTKLGFTDAYFGAIIDGFSGERLTYTYEADENNSIELEISFEGEEQNLYMVKYEIKSEK